MLCTFSTVLKNLMWNKNGTQCASFRNVPVLESRLCHFLVTWPWTSHKTINLGKAGRTHGENISLGCWEGQWCSEQDKVFPDKEQSSPPECSSNAMWSPVESRWKFDTWGYNNSSAQQEEERLLSFPGKDTGNEKPWTLKEPSELIPLYKSTLQPWHFGDLHFALHKCRPQTAILWWFWICSSLLEKNIWQSICSGQQREWNQQDWESTWKIPKGKLSTWHIWVDTSLRLIRCRNTKTKKIKSKLQKINLNLLGSSFCCKDIPVNLTIPLGCSISCLRLWLLYKITKTHQAKHSLGTGQGQRKSPGELTQPPSTACGFLTVNEE